MCCHGITAVLVSGKCSGLFMCGGKRTLTTEQQKAPAPHSCWGFFFLFWTAALLNGEALAHAGQALRQNITQAGISNAIDPI